MVQDAKNQDFHTKYSGNLLSNFKNNGEKIYWIHGKDCLYPHKQALLESDITENQNCSITLYTPLNFQL